MAKVKNNYEAEWVRQKMATAVSFVFMAVSNRIGQYAHAIRRYMENAPEQCQNEWKQPIRLGKKKHPGAYAQALRMCELTGNMRKLLEGRATHKTATHPWLVCYREDYVKQMRGMHISQMLVDDACREQANILEEKTRLVVDAQNSTHPDVLTTGLLSVTWISIGECSIRDLCKYLVDKTGSMEGLSMANLMLKQLNAVNTCVELIASVLCNMKHDEQDPMWVAVHEAGNDVQSKIVGSLYDDNFNEVFNKAHLQDWIDYYIGRAVIDTQTNGECPKDVIQEITNLGNWNGTHLRLPFQSLLQQVSKKVQPTDDPYDVADYLDEHTWKIRNTLVEVCNERIITEARAEERVWDTLREAQASDK